MADDYYIRKNLRRHGMNEQKRLEYRDRLDAMMQAMIIADKTTIADFDKLLVKAVRVCELIDKVAHEASARSVTGNK